MKKQVVNLNDNKLMVCKLTLPNGVVGLSMTRDFGDDGDVYSHEKRLGSKHYNEDNIDEALATYSKELNLPILSITEIIKGLKHSSLN